MSDLEKEFITFEQAERTAINRAGVGSMFTSMFQQAPAMGKWEDKHKARPENSQDWQSLLQSVTMKGDKGD